MRMHGNAFTTFSLRIITRNNKAVWAVDSPSLDYFNIITMYQAAWFRMLAIVLSTHFGALSL